MLRRNLLQKTPFHDFDFITALFTEFIRIGKTLKTSDCWGDVWVLAPKEKREQPCKKVELMSVYQIEKKTYNITDFNLTFSWNICLLYSTTRHMTKKKKLENKSAAQDKVMHVVISWWWGSLKWLEKAVREPLRLDIEQAIYSKTLVVTGKTL